MDSPSFTTSSKTMPMSSSVSTSRAYSFCSSNLNPPIPCGLKIKRSEGQTAGVGNHVSTYQGNPVWNSGALEPKPCARMVLPLPHTRNDGSPSWASSFYPARECRKQLTCWMGQKLPFLFAKIGPNQSMSSGWELKWLWVKTNGIPSWLGLMNSPPILERILVGIGMFTGGTGF